MSWPFAFDAHVDSLQLALDLGADLGVSSPGQLDLPRARAGRLGAVVLTSWVDPRYLPMERGGARARADALFDQLDALVGQEAGDFQRVLTQADLRTALQSDGIAALAGIEGAHPLESVPGAGDWLEGLEHFYARGLRVLTLVWNNHLPWIRSCEPDPGAIAPPGLGPLGAHLVARMNELGIVVDLSHAGPRSFHDALEASSKPVIASHSACKAIHAHQRNLDDEQLRALANNGGVIGMPFPTTFLDGESQREAAQLRSTPEYRDLRGETPSELEVLRTAFMAKSLTPLSIERLVDHVVHAVEVAGIDHVGLGSDFDGITTPVEGLEDASGYGALVEPLGRRGLTGGEVAQIMGGNMARVFDEVLPPA